MVRRRRRHGQNNGRDVLEVDAKLEVSAMWRYSGIAGGIEKQGKRDGPGSERRLKCSVTSAVVAELSLGVQEV